MNTGRNLTVISVGILVYVMSGAEFQSMGVSGLSWSIEFPGVIKFFAVVFWVWLVILHWLTRSRGEYYRAWSESAKQHRHRGIARQSAPERTPEHVSKDVQRLAEHFGVKLNDQAREAPGYGLVYVLDVDKPGMYVLRMSGHVDNDPEQSGGIVNSVPRWQIPPISDRVGFFRLHLNFPDVVFRTWKNSPDVLSRRVLPWAFAALALVAIAANQVTDVASLTGPWFESIAGDSECSTSESM